MPVRTFKRGGRWCAKWGGSGKTYCSKSKKRAVAKASKQARAAYASGYRGGRSRRR